jgi:hypothetical protein
VPVDRLADPVEVLLELPGEAALPDAPGPGDRDQPRPPIAARRGDEVLQEPELLVPAHEGRLREVRATLAAALGDDAQGSPGRDRGRLALEGLLAGRLEGDRPGGGPLGRLADEDRAGGGHGLQAGGGVDEVARDHALVRRPQGDRRLAGQDPGPGRDRRAEGAHRVDEVEGGPHGPLGVVLAGGGRSPDRHDRVADELLDRPPIAPDDVGGDLEVAGQGVADVLRVALLGERGEADEVGEQDRHEAPLGDDRRAGELRRRSARARRSDPGGDGRAALPAEGVTRVEGRPA